MKKMYYISFFDDYNNNRNLETQPSGVSKSNYIINALASANFNIEVLSIALCKKDKFLFLKKKNKIMSRYFKIVYIANIGRVNRFFCILSVIFQYLQLLLFLLKRNSQDLILVYHSKRTSKFISFVSRIKKLRIYFEIEEIYSAVYQQSDFNIKNEINTLNCSKGNIVVNDILHTKLPNDLINIPCYGIYKHCVEPKKIDKKNTINVLYAGVIGELDSDVYVAIHTAKYLPKNYCIHILGYGSIDNISKLEREIRNLSSEACPVIYHGCMFGKQYSDFLLKCHIGLCTRTLVNKFSDYTFPSKIFVYLANNIIPVCSNIDCVKKSKISSEIYFVQELSPDCIAKKIQTINVDVIDYKNQLSILHKDFINDIKKLFK